MVLKKEPHRERLAGWHPFTDEEINRYVSKGFWHNLTVCDLLDRNVERFPGKLAVVDDSTEVTWKELKRRSNRLAIQLRKLGVECGDFFVFQLPNVVESLYMYFALNRLGAIPIMCLPRHRRLEISYEIRLHEAKGICVAVGEKFDYVGMVEELRQNHPYLRIFLTTGEEAPRGWLSIERLIKKEVEQNYPPDYLGQFKPDPNDICTEQLSGGTTGVPKGIPRTHSDYICQWDYLGRVAGWTEDSIPLVAIPAMHNAPLQHLCGPTIFRGGTIVLTKLTRPQDQFRLIEKYKITHAMLIPVQITYWMEAEELLKNYNLSSFKVMISGAQKVRPDIVEWCINTLGANFVNSYGMAEGPVFNTRWDSPKEAQMHTVGMPIIIDPEVQIKLVDSQNQEVRQGEVGEMVIKGPLTFKGYFRAEEENKKAFDEQGFFHSGDLMSLREDGRYVVEGRKKDMILRGGENVYPERVEDKIMHHPKVVNCVAIGMPDLRFGERLCAFVQPRKGESISFDEIVSYLKDEGLAIFELPERIEVVEGWPLTAVNKINKRLLRTYITAKLFEEGVISKGFGNEYLKNDKITIDDVISGKVKIEFSGIP